MFEYIQGKITAKHIRYAVADVGGVGYRIEISLSAGEKLKVGDNARLYIHSVLREDSHTLYGFLDDEERRVFRSLIGISSVGPKLAMNILGTLSVGELGDIVREGHVQQLLRVPNVGNKMARRLINELGDAIAAGSADASPGRREAENALVSLGYKRPEAATVLERIQRSGTGTESESGSGSDMSTEELVRAALKDLAAQRRA